MGRKRLYANDAERQLAYRNRQQLKGQATTAVHLPVDVIATLDQLATINNVTRGDILQTLILSAALEQPLSPSSC